MKIKKESLKFILPALCCTALWGTAFPGVKKGYELFAIAPGDTGGKLMFAGVRFMLAGAALIIIYIIKNKKFPSFSKKQAPAIFLLALLQIAGNYFFYYLGLSVTAGSVASVLNSSDTFLTVLSVPLFFKSDRLNFRKLFGCVIGTAGIVLVNLSGLSSSGFRLAGEGFIIISALFSTASIMLNKKAASSTDPATVTGWYLFLGGWVLILAALICGGRISFSSFKADALLLYLCFVSSAAFLIWSHLLKNNDVSRVSVFKLMTPIFGNVFSALILGENILSPLHLLSVALVALGIAAVNYRPEKRLNTP